MAGEFIADEKAIWQLAVHYARASSLGKLAAHDLGRYAECRIIPNSPVVIAMVRDGTKGTSDQQICIVTNIGFWLVLCKRRYNRQ